MLLLYLQKSFWFGASRMDARTAQDQQDALSLHNSMGLWKNNFQFNKIKEEEAEYIRKMAPVKSF